MMKTDAIFFTGPRALDIRTEDLGAPAAGEALVKTLVTAISPGTEMLMYRGQMPQGMAADDAIASLNQPLEYPVKYGYCAVGVVLEIGPGVDTNLVGRKVFSFQPHQSGFISRVSDLRVLPDGFSHDDAVFLPNMETALGLVMDGAPLAGERVAVLGQGIVGLLTTKLLASFPLDRLFTFDRYPARRKASLMSGAVVSLPPDGFPKEMSHHFDLVYELSGVPAALDTAIALAGDQARIVIGSWYGSKRSTVNLGDHFHRGRLIFISSQVSNLAPHLSGRWTKDRRLEFALEMIRRFEPANFITHRFPLSEAHEAYRLIDQEPQKSIQVVFEYV